MSMRSTLPAQAWRGASESELLSAMRAGQREAWHEAMTRFSGVMLATARGIASEHAEDVVQEAWISAHGAIDKFQQRSSIKTWLVRITMNAACNQLRRLRQEVSLEGLGVTHDSLAGVFTQDGRWHFAYHPWSDDTPDALLQADALKECIDQHLAAMPAGQRMALTLHDIDGITSSEICKTLAVSPQNFRVLLHRARMRILNLVSQYEQTGVCILPTR